jgi:hypothetical protein
MAGLDPVDAFYLALDETPDDQVTLLALGDWYEEQDKPDAAACVRWAARHDYRPFLFRANSSPDLPPASDNLHDGWYWWAINEFPDDHDWGHPSTCRLPRNLWNLLRHTCKYKPLVLKEYPTRRLAYEALIEAWAVVRPADRRPSREVPR